MKKWVRFLFSGVLVVVAAVAVKSVLETPYEARSSLDYILLLHISFVGLKATE